MSGGVKPSRAQAGSGLTDGGLAQLAPAFPGEASAGDACPGDICAADDCACFCGFPLHAVTVTSETVITASPAPSRYLISRWYAGHDAAYRNRPAQVLGWSPGRNCWPRPGTWIESLGPVIWREV